MAHHNTSRARAIMIDMICSGKKTNLNAVNAAIANDKSSIEQGSFDFVKNACKWFKKYPDLKNKHIAKPYTWTEFTKVVKHLEGGGTI